MTRFVELTMVTGQAQDQHSDAEIEREGEDDGIVEVPAPVTNERTVKTMVQLDAIRNFYPRKQRSDGFQPVGTRITFMNGSGAAVTETYAQVAALVN